MMRNSFSLFFCAIVVAAALGVPVNAGADAPRLTTELIQQVLNAAVAKANAIKVPMGISIVEQGGNLVGFIKMEGTFVHT
ncbi:MAG: heme-binding protein, partial [Gammaproteobacteria bacterium]|nr:heme-binding protein [Gammaproteobacteria bacterium]